MVISGAFAPVTAGADAIGADWAAAPTSAAASALALATSAMVVPLRTIASADIGETRAARVDFKEESL
jgi:hypothetical protein